MIEIKFKRVEPNNPNLKNLLSELDLVLKRLYPDRPIFGIDLKKATSENVHFLIGYFDNHAICCGALRLFQDNTCELKRMYVKREYRGEGFSKKIYYELENLAIIHKKNIIKLETGKKQTEAINLYKSLGFDKIPNYGDFIHDDISVCFSKNIFEK